MCVVGGGFVLFPFFALNPRIAHRCCIDLSPASTHIALAGQMVKCDGFPYKWHSLFVLLRIYNSAVPVVMDSMPSRHLATGMGDPFIGGL